MSDRRKRSPRSLWFFPSHRAPRPVQITAKHIITADRPCRSEIPAFCISRRCDAIPAQTNHSVSRRDFIPAAAASSRTDKSFRPQPRHHPRSRDAIPAQANHSVRRRDIIPAGVTCAVSGYKSSIRFADVI